MIEVSWPPLPSTQSDVNRCLILGGRWIRPGRWLWVHFNKGGTIWAEARPVRAWLHRVGGNVFRAAAAQVSWWRNADDCQGEGGTGNETAWPGCVQESLEEGAQHVGPAVGEYSHRDDLPYFYYSSLIWAMYIVANWSQADGVLVKGFFGYAKYSSSSILLRSPYLNNVSQKDGMTPEQALEQVIDCTVRHNHHHIILVSSVP